MSPTKMSVSTSRIGRLTVACSLLFILLVAGGLAVIRLESAQRAAVGERLLVSQAAEVRAALGDELSQSVNLARGLRAFVISYPDLGDPERFEVLLAELYSQGNHIRNIGVAPDNELRFVYPLEGNEDAIGLRYEGVPEQFAAVELAIRTQESVLAGPVDLVQGGRGLIDRTPVFLPDGSYWGVVSLVLDVDSLLERVQANVGDIGLEWALRTIDNEIQPATIVGGDQAIFDRARAVATLAVPNGEWELAVEPAAASGTSVAATALSLLAIGIAALVSWLVFEATRARWRATALSLQDDLTGLANRRLLEERIERALATAVRQRRHLALVYLDLDSFKAINDTHGHDAGDAVLREMADRLRNRIRQADTAARVGGDEFVVLLPDTAYNGAESLAESLTALIDRPVTWNDVDLPVRASIGISVYPDHGSTIDELLAHADTAMYDVKQVRHSGRE